MAQQKSLNSFNTGDVIIRTCPLLMGDVIVNSSYLDQPVVVVEQKEFHTLIKLVGYEDCKPTILPHFKWNDEYWILWEDEKNYA